MRKQIIWFILIAFFVGGLAGVVFNRYLMPALSNLPGLSGLRDFTTNAPIVINRREVVQLNEGVNLVELTKQASNLTVSIYSGKDPAKLLGNGVAMSSDGLVFTAKEVVASQTDVRVVLNDGSVHTGAVRALDPKTELAIITVNAKDLKSAQLSDGSLLQIGQRVLALGRTDKEFTRRFASGMVTKSVYNNANPDKVFSTELIEETFETDAVLNSGYAGGPVVNLEGRIVGMVANAAGKILLAESMETALRSYLDNGKVQRPYIGIRYMPVSRSAAALKQLPDTGALVMAVETGPAKTAGLAVNDIIVEANGQKVAETSLEHIVDKNYLSELRLTILRAGQKMEITVKPEIR